MARGLGFKPAAQRDARGRFLKKAGAGDGIEITLLGVEDIQEVFRKLGKRVANKVLRKAMRAGMKPVQKRAKDNAPVLTGETKAAIVTRAARRSRKGQGIDVRVGEGSFKGDTFHAWFVERGTKIRLVKSTGQNVGRIKAEEFMRQAYVDEKANARRITDREIVAGTMREARALASKGTPT